MTNRNAEPGKDGGRTTREKRLAEALRANLRRRKSAAGAKPAVNPGSNVAVAPETAPESENNED